MLSRPRPSLRRDLIPLFTAQWTALKFMHVAPVAEDGENKKRADVIRYMPKVTGGCQDKDPEKCQVWAASDECVKVGTWLT